MASDWYSSRKPRDYAWAVIRYNPDMAEPETQFTVTQACTTATSPRRR